jgi:hypothetical protein
MRIEVGTCPFKMLVSQVTSKDRHARDEIVNVYGGYCAGNKSRNISLCPHFVKMLDESNFVCAKERLQQILELSNAK